LLIGAATYQLDGGPVGAGAHGIGEHLRQFDLELDGDVGLVRRPSGSKRRRERGSKFDQVHNEVLGSRNDFDRSEINFEECVRAAGREYSLSTFLRADKWCVHANGKVRASLAMI
jgi:hypothetical protein